MDIGHNHGLISYTIPTMKNSDSTVGVSYQYWTKHLITSTTDWDKEHGTHLTSYILSVQISLENKCSFKVSVHLEHDTVSYSRWMDTSSTLLQKPAHSNTIISLTVENKQMNIWKKQITKWITTNIRWLL
jgi:hypothetical protein